MVTIGYGEKNPSSFTSGDERGGASLTEAKTIEQEIPQAEPNTLFVSVSPKGPTGRYDSNGNELKHPETQVKAYRKLQGDKLNCVTIRTDLDLQQSVDLVGLIAKDPNIFEGDENVINVVTSTVVSRSDLDIEGVINAIKNIKSSDIAWSRKDEDDKIVLTSFAEMFEALNIALSSGSTKTNTEVEELFQKLADKLLNYNGHITDEQIAELGVLIGKTLVDTYAVLKNRKGYTAKQIVKKMENLSGCVAVPSAKVETRIRNGKVEYKVLSCPFCGEFPGGKWMFKGQICGCGHSYPGPC